MKKSRVLYLALALLTGCFFGVSHVLSATVTYTVRDSGTLGYTNALGVSILELFKASPPSIGSGESIVKQKADSASGTDIFSMGYLDFLMEPPFFEEHPDVTITAVSLKLNLLTPNPLIEDAEYQVINLESLLNPSEPNRAVDIDANNSDAEIYTAFDTGVSMASFADFSQSIGAAITIPLNKEHIDLSGKTVNYYLGIRERGDDDGFITFNGVNQIIKPELTITYEKTVVEDKDEFSWITVLPAIITGGNKCSAQNLQACTTQQTCEDVGGHWDGARCSACPYTGNYAGTWQETSCDGFSYSGSWHGSVNENCYFKGADEDEDDFLEGSVDPSTGRAQNLSGVETECGYLSGTGTFTSSGVDGTFTGPGVNGTYTGTKQ